MAGKLKLRVVTPDRILFDDIVDMVILRSTEGDLGVQPGHYSLSLLLGYGALRLKTSDGERVMAVMGGLAEIINDEITIMSDAAEWPEDIDKARAEAAKQRAEQRLAFKEGSMDVRRAELAMRRSLVRMEVSTYPIIKNRFEK